MKKLALLFALLFATPVYAGVPCSLPFNLQNATIADATQVMANYNAIITCLGNAAAAGANNDITSLSALSTPISPANGGTTNYIGSTSTGTNAQVVSSTTPSTFSLQAGREVRFVVGSGNTGPTTLNVSSSGALNLFRRTQLGVSAMVGGELVAGHVAIAVYDGTQYILTSAGPYQVGEIRNYAGASAPTGWAFIDGSCQLRTGIWADLFAVASTFYDPTGSTCDSAHFALPDGRGRALVGLDNMGTNGTAGRITNAGSGCTGTILGNGGVSGTGCGSENRTAAQMPAHHHSLFLHDPGHSHDLRGAANNSGAAATAFLSSSAGGLISGTGGTGIVPNTTSITPQSAADVGGVPQGVANQTSDTGTGPSVSVLQPMGIVTQIIKL